jgi:hypothetical protein
MMGWGLLSIDPLPEKILSLGPLNGFCQKWVNLAKKLPLKNFFLANPRDFRKSAVKFQKII